MCNRRSLPTPEFSVENFGSNRERKLMKILLRLINLVALSLMIGLSLFVTLLTGKTAAPFVVAGLWFFAIFAWSCFKISGINEREQSEWYKEAKAYRLLKAEHDNLKIRYAQLEQRYLYPHKT